MTECDEIARSMKGGYRAWLENTCRTPNMQTARIYAQMQLLPGESFQFVDNVAYSLLSDYQVAIPKPEPTYADMGTW